jgi:hypothetical protein
MHQKSNFLSHMTVQGVCKMTKLAMPGLLLFVLFIGLAGCIHHQVMPQLQQVDEPLLPQLNTKQSVAIVAIHNSTTKPAEFCTAGAHHYHARMDDLTDAAKISLGDILKRKNITVNERSDKIYKISVVNANCVSGFFTMNISVKINVHAGDTITGVFNGTQIIGHVFQTEWAVSMAINDALLNMLKKEEIVHYLEN